jgi:hypothetical protein
MIRAPLNTIIQKRRKVRIIMTIISSPMMIFDIVSPFNDFREHNLIEACHENQYRNELCEKKLFYYNFFIENIKEKW